jgi:hypothetical protein
MAAIVAPLLAGPRAGGRRNGVEFAAGRRQDGRVSGPGADGRLLEIACDESGYEGDKLIGATTRLFAHASMHLDAEAAADCMQELRNRIRSPATEYKATHVLREKHRAVLGWLLGASGPLLGNASLG